MFHNAPTIAETAEELLPICKTTPKPKQKIIGFVLKNHVTCLFLARVEDLYFDQETNTKSKQNLWRGGTSGGLEFDNVESDILPVYRV